MCFVAALTDSYCLLTVSELTRSQGQSMSMEGVVQGAASDPMAQQHPPPHKVSIMSQENIVMQKKEEARRRCEQLRQLSLGGHVQNGT